MRKLLFLAIALACSPAAPLTLAPATGGIPLAARVDSFVAPYVATNNFAGVILVARGDSVLLESGYGQANAELGVPNTPRSRFHVASVTKAFTAAAILLLEERGQLSTGDNVARYLPDYPNGEKLRLEHLLTHTSGIPNLSGPDWAREERLPHSTAELVGLFKDKALEFEPGSKTSYSNSNYNLLTLIAETVTHRSYGDLMRGTIFAPLDLHATLHDVESRSLAKILAPAEGFAYGWARDERLGRKQMRSGGRSPGFNASVEHYLDDGTEVIVLTNSYSPVGQDPVFLDGLHSEIFGRRTKAPAIAPVAVRAGSLAELAGQYRMPHDYFIPDAMLALVDQGGHLEARWEEGAVNTIYPIGPNRFLDRNHWAEVSFTRDAARGVTGFEYKLGPGFVAKRVGP